MTKWYAVYARSGDPDPDTDIWTVSKDPTECGWETDCGQPGYGLSRTDAEFLAAAANEKIERERYELVRPGDASVSKKRVDVAEAKQILDVLLRRYTKAYLAGLTGLSEYELVRIDNLRMRTVDLATLQMLKRVEIRP